MSAIRTVQLFEGLLFRSPLYTQTLNIVNLDNHPQKWEIRRPQEDVRTTRSTFSGTVIEDSISSLSKSTFINDAKKSWNRAPSSIKSANSLAIAKKAIKTFVKTLPI